MVSSSVSSLGSSSTRLSSSLLHDKVFAHEQNSGQFQRVKLCILGLLLHCMNYMKYYYFIQFMAFGCSLKTLIICGHTDKRIYDNDRNTESI